MVDSGVLSYTGSVLLWGEGDERILCCEGMHGRWDAAAAQCPCSSIMRLDSSGVR